MPGVCGYLRKRPDGHPANLVAAAFGSRCRKPGGLSQDDSPSNALARRYEILGLGAIARPT
jgi:hypothetical protein